MNRAKNFFDTHDDDTQSTISYRHKRRVQSIQNWLVEKIAGVIEVGRSSIDTTVPFASYGLESIDVVGLSGDLQEWLQRELPPTLLYDYPNIKDLAHYLAADMAVNQPEIDDGTHREIGTEPIAVIGLGCRFPGAKNPREFWQLLCDGTDAIREVPAERWDINRFYNEDMLLAGKMNTRWGGFLEGIDAFDAHFFGISPREAQRMDPQQRLLLEVVWEALEDAGLSPTNLAGSPTGVFVGIANSDYGRMQFRDPALSDAYAGTGSAYSIAANRISYLLDCRGPSMAIDTACSSSLVAVHLACQSIWRGEAALALAGGVNVMLSPEVTVNFTKSGFMAPDGRCKAFDAKANGYVRGEGAGIVVLKPLKQALAAGDSIYAVIRGSAVNQDGRTNGLTAPNRQSQEAVLHHACTMAGVPPGQVQYIEAHGTGTSLGDPIEATALGNVLTVDRPPENICRIGSVKTNIGHLEAAAGIAGLIKVALSLKHRMIPPSLHFSEPNPYIPFAELPLRVQTALTPWPAYGSSLLAGVSSFGFGGTNAHVVLESVAQPHDTHKINYSSRRPYLLPLSAANTAALQKLALAYRDMLTSQDTKDTVSLADICYTASMRRNHYDYRLACLAHTSDEFTQYLERYLHGEQYHGLNVGRKEPGSPLQLVFVFPGQGAQWIGMGRQLLEREPAFAEALATCEEAIRPYVDWSLRSVLSSEGDGVWLERIDIIQPALFAIQVSLAALWRSWGIVPHAVVGHSMGEVAAAYIAGALSLNDAARIICLRSKLLSRVSGQGAMAVVELSLEEAEQVVAHYADRLSVAVSNSPRSTVLSGEPDALEKVLDSLEQRNIFCRRIKVDVASHSPQMDPLRDELVRILDGIQPCPTTIPMYSTVTGIPCSGEELDAAYWVRNLRDPVRFAAVIQRLVTEGYRCYLELSPHPILLPAIEEGLQYSQCEGLALSSMRRAEEEQTVLLESLGAIYAHGYEVDWQKLYPDGGTCVSLPTYPWQRERFWLEPEKSTQRSGTGNFAHPLLGQHIESSIQAGVHYWEYVLNCADLPYLNDHRVQGQVVVPAAAYLEMALAAAKEAFGAGPHVLEELTFTHMLVLDEETAQTMQVSLSNTKTGKATFQISGRSTRPGDEAWTLHASGTIRLENASLDSLPKGQAEFQAPINTESTPEEIRARCTDVIPGSIFYDMLREHGLEYGTSFQAIEQICYRDGEALACLQVSEQVEMQAHSYTIHPALLDACFQVAGAVISQSKDTKASPDRGRAIYLPTGLTSLRVYGHLAHVAKTLWSHVLLQSQETTPVVPGKRETQTVWTADLELLDAQGQLLLEARGLRVQQVIAHDSPQETLNNWLYTIAWHPQPRQENHVPTITGTWLVFSDRGRAGRQLQTLLQGRGERCVMVLPGKSYEQLNAQHYRLDPTKAPDVLRLLEDVYGDDSSLCAGIVHLWSLENMSAADTTPDTLNVAQQLGCGSVLHLVQALSLTGWRTLPRLWLVTRGTQAIEATLTGIEVAQSPLWGLGRTIMHEHPRLRCTLVDLSRTEVFPEEIEALAEELWEKGPEDQLALRGKTRYVAHLDRYLPQAGTAKDERRVRANDQPFRLEIDTPGILDGLTLRAATRRRPGPGEVEIEVAVASLNFLDVLKALGIAPAQEPGSALLGSECAGTITAVGTGVSGLAIGDEVVALADGCFGTHVTTPVNCVVGKPAHQNFEQAAAIPIAFMTAHYALHSLARITRGERVLIHSAAGGTGLAAVQVAQVLGAEIFATAGSPEKREYLRSLGIQHVMDSRSLSFREEVLNATGGQGVDIILNSLTGAAMAQSISVLRPYGRFIELGKKDIYQNSLLELAPFRKNLSYFALDLAGMVRERPEKVGALFKEVMRAFEEGLLKPPPMRVFPINKADEAFHLMAQARHTGKLVLSLRDRAETLIALAPTSSDLMRADSTYLITGGLGGIGLRVARWLVERGARHLVLLGRSRASAVVEEQLAALTNHGVQVRVAQVDVSQTEQVAALLTEIEHSMPPLRGVLHAAGMLDDGMLLNLNVERFQKVLEPKMLGAWNLHTLTQDMPLDFFVLFSSAASLLGSPGQGNYSAANAFLDALAHHRQALNLPALSINWGPWTSVGLAATLAKRGERLALMGIGSLSPVQGEAALGALLGQRAAQIAVMPLNVRQWRQSYPQASRSPFLAKLTDEAESKHPAMSKVTPIRAALLAASPHERRVLLEGHLCEQTARVLRLNTSQIDANTALTSLGFDSLMALELRNRLENNLAVTLHATVAWRYPTIATLTDHVAEMLGITLVAAVPRSENTVHFSQKEEEDIVKALGILQELSNDELDAALTPNAYTGELQ